MSGLPSAESDPAAEPNPPVDADEGAALAAVIDPEDDGLVEGDLLHSSRMTPRFGLLMSLLTRIFFSPVRFPDRVRDTIADCAGEGVPVYVMNRVSRLDHLYFNYALARAALPLAEFSNGVDMTWFHPWRNAINAWFRRRFGRRETLMDSQVVRGLVRRRKSVLLFLRRGFSFTALGTQPKKLTHLRDLVTAQRSCAFPVYVVPQVLVWERKLDSGRKNLLETFFGDPQAPGVLRKAFSFAVNHRRAFVRLGEPIDLQAFLREHDAVADDALLAERLRLLLVQRFKSEDRVMRGAPVRPPAVVAGEIIEDPGFAAELQQAAGEQGLSSEAARSEARASLMEIAADLKLWMVDVFSFFLTLIWARIYEGIEVDEEGLERVKRAGRDAPVCVVPSHKSHIDYLIISYVFHGEGMVPPHIAAGANLNFWPIGPMFRRAGAFFLRRSFRGQPIYSAAFKAYLRKLLKEGHWLEFFPEGTRSRTGKLLPPRYGMLRMVLSAVADGAVRDVMLAPVNFGYERLIEEGAYRKELEGGEKRAESGLEMLRATQVLVHKYGRMRIQFAEPLSVRDMLQAEGVMQGARERDPGTWDRAVKRAGYRILHGINAAGVMTTTALTAGVLMTNPHRGIARDDLLTRLGLLLTTCMARGAVLSGALSTKLEQHESMLVDALERDVRSRVEAGGFPDPLGAQSHHARAIGAAVEPLVEAVLDVFAGQRWIFRTAYGDDEVYVVKREGRLHLDYYKNNMIAPLVPDALFAAALLAELDAADTVDPDDLRESTRFLSLLLKFEFVYDPDIGLDDQYERVLQRWVDAGWLVETSDGLLRLRHKVLPVARLYGKLVHNFIESYLVMGRALTVLQKGPMDDKEFLGHCQTEAGKLSEIGIVQCHEAVSKVNLLNALAIFLEQKYIDKDTELQGKKAVKLLKVRIGERTSAQFATFVRRIEMFHEPWRV